MRYTEIQLDEKEITRIRSYKTFGADWAEMAIDAAKARMYLNTFFDRTHETTSRRSCYSEGIFSYSRKDGQPITAEDFEALQRMNSGQENTFSISEDNQTMIHKYLCDSSG